MVPTWLIHTLFEHGLNTEILWPTIALQLLLNKQLTHMDLENPDHVHIYIIHSIYLHWHAIILTMLNRAS